MRRIPVILFGMGGVGATLLRQTLELRRFHADEYGIEFSFTAICDRNGAVIAMEGGLDDELLAELVDLKQQGGHLVNHPLGGPQVDSYSIVDIAGRGDALVVDCTASEATIPGLLYALERKYRVVMANKKPLTADQETYDLFVSAAATNRSKGARRNLSMLHWETTVGAGLPVNTTLGRLYSSGDTVQQIMGAFSGTLGYVMSGLQQGQPFSQVVSEAYRQGYTEPDPRDDLSGLDVARKALILARGIGWKLELTDIPIESLYPAEMNSLSVSEFIDALPTLDDAYREKVADAERRSQVLRYAATVADNHCKVGLVFVPATSPLGRLTGTDNLVEFTTRWYNPTPLVIQGRGAGQDATAAGVLSDMVELATVQ